MQIKDSLLQGQQRFNLALGTANFNAWVENARLHSEVEEQRAVELLKIHSAVPSEKIVKLEFEKDSLEDGSNYLEEELMPADYVGNGNRELSKLIRVLFSTEGKPFLAELNAPFFAVPDGNGNLQNILFLE